MGGGSTGVHEAANRGGKRAHVDRLLEVAGEARLLEPVADVALRERAPADDGDGGGPVVRGEATPHLRTVEIGETEVEQDEVGPVLACQLERIGRRRRGQRPQPVVFEHVAREPHVPLVVVDDQHERFHCVILLATLAIRVVLADDHYLVREGIRRLLEGESAIEVVAVAEDLDSLLAAVDEHGPDVVVTDIRMPPTGVDEGVQAADRLRESHPDVGVVVLSQYAEPGYAVALLDAGTARRAYLLKERVDDVQQLVGAIEAVAGGGSMIDPKIVEALVAEKGRAEASPLDDLTPRERDVLREMAEGKNNAAIASALFLTERSVEKVIHSIFLKLGIGYESSIHKRVKAVILYLAASG